MSSYKTILTKTICLMRKEIYNKYLLKTMSDDAGAVHTTMLLYIA